MNWKSNSIIAAAIIAAGITAGGMAVRSGIVSFKEMDRVVKVKGLSEREVNADKVTWQLKYKEIGNDPSEMYTLMERKNHTVVNFLTKAGLTNDEISVGAPIITDRQADQYDDRIMAYRYRATCAITVTSGNVDLVRQLMKRQPELMKQGVAIVGNEYSNDNGATFEFTKLNEIKPAMIEEATKNARVVAEKFADDSGSRIGGIRTATQGLFSIEERDYNTPHIKRVRVVTTVEYTLK